MLEFEIKEFIEDRFLKLSVVTEQKGREELFDLTIKSNIWHVRSPYTRPVKFRPYEAVLPIANFYEILNFLTSPEINPEVIEHADIVSETNGIQEVVLKQGPIFQQYTNQAWRFAQPPMLLSGSSNFPGTHQVPDLHLAAREGLRFKVDMGGGLIREASLPHGLTLEFTNFEPLTTPIEVPSEAWIDQTQPPAEKAGLRFLGGFCPRGAEDSGSDTHFFNGVDFRRIPSLSGSSRPGCFLATFTEVLVHAPDFDSQSISPFRIDLTSGQSSLFGGPTFRLPGGLSFGGSLSPDRKKVALLYRAASTHPSEDPRAQVQIYSVELNTQKTTAIGPTGVYTTADYLSDNRNLLVERLNIQVIASKTVPRPEICMLSLKGKLTHLAFGSEAVEIVGRRILFRREADRQWATMNFKGQKQKPFWPIVKNDYEFPCVSHAGVLVSFTTRNENGTTSPFVIEAFSGEQWKITWPPGVWTSPKFFR